MCGWAILYPGPGCQHQRRTGGSNRQRSSYSPAQPSPAQPSPVQPSPAQPGVMPLGLYIYIIIALAAGKRTLAACTELLSSVTQNWMCRISTSQTEWLSIDNYNLFEDLFIKSNEHFRVLTYLKLSWTLPRIHLRGNLEHHNLYYGGPLWILPGTGHRRCSRWSKERHHNRLPVMKIINVDSMLIDIIFLRFCQHTWMLYFCLAFCLSIKEEKNGNPHKLTRA